MSSLKKKNLINIVPFAASIEGLTKKRILDHFDYYSKYFNVYIVTHENLPKFIRTNKILKFIYYILAPLLFKEIKNSDVIKVSESSMIIAFFSKLFFPHVKIVAEYHYKYNKLFYKVSEFLMKYFADKIILQTHSLGKDLYPFYSEDKKYDKLLHIPNYVNTKIFRPFHVPIKDKLITDKFVIGWVGYLDKHRWDSKNIETVFKAINLLPQSLRDIIHLELVGSIGLYFQNYLLKKYPKVKVSFPGAVPHENLPPYYNNFSLFIFPSIHEGSPKALLEALACGCLIVVNDLEELKEVIQHNKNGIVIDCNDPMKLKNEIYDLIKNPDKRIRLRNNAYQDSKQYDMALILKKDVEFMDID